MRGGAGALAVLTPLRIEAWFARRGLEGARVVCTGMGPRRSRRAARRLRGQEGLRAFAVVGLCGALDPGVEPGALVVASEVRGPAGPRACDDPERLAAALEALGLEVRVGPVLGVDHLVRRAERRAIRETGCLAVDMESAWLAEAAGSRPFAVLRAVSDAPGRELFTVAGLRGAWRALRCLAAATPALESWSRDLTGR